MMFSICFTAEAPSSQAAANPHNPNRVLDLSLQKKEEGSRSSSKESKSTSKDDCDKGKSEEKKTATNTMESLAAQLSLTLFTQNFLNKQKNFASGDLKQTSRRKLNKTRKISAGFA